LAKTLLAEIFCDRSIPTANSSCYKKRLHTFSFLIDCAPRISLMSYNISGRLLTPHRDLRCIGYSHSSKQRYLRLVGPLAYFKELLKQLHGFLSEVGGGFRGAQLLNQDVGFAVAKVSCVTV